MWTRWCESSRKKGRSSLRGAVRERRNFKVVRRIIAGHKNKGKKKDGWRRRDSLKSESENEMKHLCSSSNRERTNERSRERVVCFARAREQHACSRSVGRSVQGGPGSLENKGLHCAPHRGLDRLIFAAAALSTLHTSTVDRDRKTLCVSYFSLRRPAAAAHPFFSLSLFFPASPSPRPDFGEIVVIIVLTVYPACVDPFLFPLFWLVLLPAILSSSCSGSEICTTTKTTTTSSSFFHKFVWVTLLPAGTRRALYLFTHCAYPISLFYRRFNFTNKFLTKKYLTTTLFNINICSTSAATVTTREFSSYLWETKLHLFIAASGVCKNFKVLHKSAVIQEVHFFSNLVKF